MPEIKVTDEKGVTHVFPEGSTPEMIAKVMGVKVGGSAPTPPAGTRTPTGDPAPGDTRNAFQRWADNIGTADPRREEWQTPTQRNVAHGAQSLAAAPLSMAAHPLETAKGMGKLLADFGTGNPYAIGQDVIAPMAETVVEDYQKHGPVYAASGLGGNILGQVATAEAMPAVVGGVKGVGRLLPKSMRALTGTGPRALKSLVKETEAGNVKETAKAAEKNTKATQEHLEKTQEALHETEGRELKYNQERDTALRAAQEEQRKIDSEHAQAVQKALDETRQKEDLYQQELRKAKAESEEAYQNKLAEVEQKRAAAEKSRRQELHQYFAKKAKAQADFKAAQDKFKTESTKQGKIEPTKTKLQTAWSNLRAGIETAREKALEIGNKKFNAVNSALNHYDSDPEGMRTLNASVIETVPGEKMPPLVKEFDNRIFGKDASGMPQGPPTYDELQSFYSKLGNALSKGTLDGETYHAYDVLHEGIGEEMQRIANDHGMSQQLLDARNYWRRMKQSFGKPFGATDAATKALRTAAPDLAEAQDQANRIRLIGSFDDRIPNLFQHVENLNKGVESLPKPVPESTRLKSLVEARKPLPSPPAKPEPITTPEPVAPREVKEPARTEIPERPSQVEPKLPAPPERVAPPDRPTEVAPDLKRIGMEDIREAKAKGLQGRTDWIRKKGASIVVTLGGYAMLRSIIRGDLAALGPDFAEMATGVGITQVLATVLENPAVARFLTEPTPRDLAKIPTELHGADLKTLVNVAQNQGIKVDPRILAYAGVAGAQASRPQKRVAAALTR